MESDDYGVSVPALNCLALDFFHVREKKSSLVSTTVILVVLLYESESVILTDTLPERITSDKINPNQLSYLSIL